MADERKAYSLRLTDDLKKRIKVAAIKRNVTMHAFIMHAIIRELKWSEENEV